MPGPGWRYTRNLTDRHAVIDIKPTESKNSFRWSAKISLTRLVDDASHHDQNIVHVFQNFFVRCDRVLCGIIRITNQAAINRQINYLRRRNINFYLNKYKH